MSFGAGPAFSLRREVSDTAKQNGHAGLLGGRGCWCGWVPEVFRAHAPTLSAVGLWVSGRVLPLWVGGLWGFVVAVGAGWFRRRSGLMPRRHAMMAVVGQRVCGGFSILSFFLSFFLSSFLSLWKHFLGVVVGVL